MRVPLRFMALRRRRFYPTTCELASRSQLRRERLLDRKTAPPDPSKPSEAPATDTQAKEIQQVKRLIKPEDLGRFQITLENEPGPVPNAEARPAPGRWVCSWVPTDDDGKPADE